MGSKTNYLIITSCIIMFNLSWSSWPFVHGSSQYNISSLDHYLHNYALNKAPKPIIDVLYNLQLPANLTGVELSFCRVRSRSIWVNSTNHISYFSIPPFTLPWRFINRVDLIYQNLGNWSTSYYNVPNYIFVTPVLGLLAYHPNTSKLDLIVMGDYQIIVRFPNISTEKIDVMKCVRFDENGTIEFSEMMKSEGLSCGVKKPGHFSIVKPNQEDIIIKRRGIVAGTVLGGFLSVIVITVVCVLGHEAWIRRKKRKKMEMMSELNMALETLRVGRSKMSLPTDIKTHPVPQGVLIDLVALRRAVIVVRVLL
ncbi:hypothetical protein CASFOL_031077 [Castilleja foliolosa]|uniref:Uncharacterized protein n=1 Tax=Castilleja foliolosa TaxID=1961234 RepID=A0ABD3C4P3_9LAMI